MRTLSADWLAACCVACNCVAAVIKLFGNVWIVLGLAAGATLFLPQLRERQSPQTRSQQACISAALLSAGMAFTRRPTEGKK